MRTERKRPKRIVPLVLTAALLVALAGTLKDQPWLLYNHTPSVPLGFYFCVGLPDARIERGDLVAFPLPEATHGYARRRGESTDVLLLKPVLAVAGDHVSTLHGELRINGALIGTVPTVDSAGRALPRWRAARTLKTGELFVGSTRTARSFDSRFFGPIHASQVVGVYRPLWVRSTDRAPSLSASAPSGAVSLGSRRRDAAATTGH